MSLLSLPTLADFLSLVEAIDADAAYRLPLVREAAPFLFEGRTAARDQGEFLADRFERWRYQLLNKRDGKLSGGARDLADSLDLAAGNLRGQYHPPRQPRAALVKPVGEAATALDVQVPLAEIFRRATELTEVHYPGGWPGSRRRMVLYAPLYLSSYCVNHCLYCGFRYPQKIDRQHLSRVEALAQADWLGQRGFRHILLVAGDFPRLTSPGYLTDIVGALAGQGFSVAVEIAAQTTASYTNLARAGACGVTLYQETYQEPLYRRYHPLGTKVWYDWRLEAPERAAEAGMKRLGLGILLGLADPRLDVQALVGHGRYLQERFPKIQLAFSLPRIHEAPQEFEIPYPVDDETFIRLYCALRLAFPSAGLVLSSREPPALRDRLAGICITQMSAGSCTSPGGYGDQEHDPRHRQQFPVCDSRSPAEVADCLLRAGFEVCWDFMDEAQGRVQADNLAEKSE